MIKVLASQMKFCRVNQGIEKGFVILSLGMLFWRLWRMLTCLHVVCTGCRHWLFLLIARHSFKTELIFKKFMGCSTFALSVIFLLGSIVKK